MRQNSIIKRILASIMVAAAISFVVTPLCWAPPALATEGVVMGQATNGEGGKLRGCKAGDQTGKEVALTGWKHGSGAYNWKYVFRAKDPSVAKKLAENMKAAAANEYVGYDQNTPDRNSLYDEAKKVNWDIASITTNCETTCGSVLSVCINAAGIEVPRTWYSEIIPKDIMKTDAFECYTSSDYVASDAKLLPGDLLVNPSHSAMVVESPNPFLFDVKYKDTHGKDNAVKAEENTEIKLLLNNGNETVSIPVEDSIDLSNYVPEKKGSKFSGWEQLDEGSFSAKYESTLSPISVNSRRIPIKN